MPKQRFQYIEIDVPFCTLTWGVGACTAALSSDTPNKCWQMYPHCGARDAFSPGVRTFKFCPPLEGVPPGQGFIPVLDGKIRETEGTVNIAGSEPTLSAFGRRATFSARCRDITDIDAYDKYRAERISGAAQFSGVGYDPGRGTFFRKLKARWPYFSGRAARVVDAWLENGVVTVDATRHYVLSAFETETPGEATFAGTDVLGIAGNEQGAGRSKRALWPKPSRGKLEKSIGTGLEQFKIGPAGIGEEYANAGFASMGSEIVSYTRSGRDITLTGRGLLGTAVASHNEGTTFQQAVRYNKVRGDVVLRDILVNGGGIPGARIPTADWEDEILRGASGIVIDTVLPKPEDVSKLVAELSVLGLTVYGDVDGEEVGLKTNRPVDIGDTTWTITDAQIVKGGISLKPRDDRRLTEVSFASVQADPTKGLSKENMLRVEYTIDGDAKDPNAFGDARLKEEAIRWINQGNDTLMRILSLRYLKRFSVDPQHVSVDVRRDQYGAAKLTDVVYLETDLIQDATGQAERRAYQIISKTRGGEGIITLVLQRYFYEGRFGRWVASPYPENYADATEAQRALGMWWVSAADPEFEPYVWV